MPLLYLQSGMNEWVDSMMITTADSRNLCITVRNKEPQRLTEFSNIHHPRKIGSIKKIISTKSGILWMTWKQILIQVKIICCAGYVCYFMWNPRPLDKLHKSEKIKSKHRIWWFEHNKHKIREAVNEREYKTFIY